MSGRFHYMRSDQRPKTLQVVAASYNSENLRTFALIVCAQRNCAGNATVICHALLRALVKLRFENLCRNRGR